jgi:hypothetical protein
MARVINTSSPGKIRNRLRRTIAELLRHLMFKRQLDEDTKDMAAAVVFALRGIHETTETTTAAWEKRDYYLKADRFRLDWEWVPVAAERLEAIIRNDRWEQLPEALAALAPHFADVRIIKMTRPPSTWRASYELLLQEGKSR